MEEPEDYVSYEEIQGDDIEESSTTIPLAATPVITKLVEVTPVTTKFTYVSPKDNTPSSPQTHPCDYGDC